MIISEYHRLSGIVWLGEPSKLFSSSLSVWEQLFWEGKLKIPSSLAVTKGGKLLISKLNWPLWNIPLWRIAVWPLFLLKGRDFTLYSSVEQQVKCCWENKWRDGPLKSNPYLSSLTPLSLVQLMKDSLLLPLLPSHATHGKTWGVENWVGTRDREKWGVRQKRTGDEEQVKV